MPSALRPNSPLENFRYVRDVVRNYSTHSANNPYFLTKHNQINFKLNSVGLSIVKKLTLFTIYVKCPLYDRPENGLKMAKRDLSGEIRKSGNDCKLDRFG